MRIVRTLLLSVFLSAPLGCGGLDELEAVQPKKEEPAAAAVPDPAARAKAALLEESKKWWDRASSLAPAEAPSSMVNCRLPDATQFMSKDDCLLRGGSPAGLSG